MGKIENKILIELIRKDKIVDTIEPDMNVEGNDLSFEITSSMHSFPLLSLKSSHQTLNNSLLSYAKKDVIRFSVALANSNVFELIFEGEFLSSQIKGESNPDSIDLDIKSIHSFYRLSLFEISLEKNYDNMFFRDFVKDILGIAEINIEVYIEPEIANITLIGVSSNTNLFRIFKEVCLIIDAVVRFNGNNTVDIRSRNSSLKQIEEQEVITINKKDISSYTRFDSL